MSLACFLKIIGSLWDIQIIQYVYVMGCRSHVFCSAEISIILGTIPASFFNLCSSHFLYFFGADFWIKRLKNEIEKLETRIADQQDRLNNI